MIETPCRALGIEDDVVGLIPPVSESTHPFADKKSKSATKMLHRSNTPLNQQH